MSVKSTKLMLSIRLHLGLTKTELGLTIIPHNDTQLVLSQYTKIGLFWKKSGKWVNLHFKLTLTGNDVWYEMLFIIRVKTINDLSNSKSLNVTVFNALHMATFH